MISLIEKEKQTENLKLSKPDFSTKAGREFLAFYLQSKLKKGYLYQISYKKTTLETRRPVHFWPCLNLSK